MKIEYKDADGRVLELEVSDEIGQFYLSSVEEAKKSDRRNTRPDRHTSLESFVYEDKRFFTAPSNPMQEAVEDCEVERLLSCLNDRQRELVVVRQIKRGCFRQIKTVRQEASGKHHVTLLSVYSAHWKKQQTTHAD